MNTENLQRLLADEIRNQLYDLIEGGVEDIEQFALGIARNALEAGQIMDPIRRQKVLEELEAQTMMLAEVYRIRVNKTKYEILNRVVNAVASTAVVFLRAVLPSS